MQRKRGKKYHVVALTVLSGKELWMRQPDGFLLRVILKPEAPSRQELYLEPRAHGINMTSMQLWPCRLYDTRQACYKFLR